MDTKLKAALIKIGQEKQSKDDPSHDFQHVLRVLNIAIKIAKEEEADLDVVIPAAIFHDVVIYPKNSPLNKNSAEESALTASRILEGFPDYPKDKISKVKTAISECSFSKGIVPDLLESKILQDADRLEAAGAIAIMRTFSSGGQMNRPFYNPDDPFYKNKDDNNAASLNLFYKRLLIVGDMMHTKAAKKMAERRTKFLHSFLNELDLELQECGVI